MVSDFNKNFGGLTGLAKKRHRSANLHTPIHPPQEMKGSQETNDFPVLDSRTSGLHVCNHYVPQFS